MLAKPPVCERHHTRMRRPALSYSGAIGITPLPISRVGNGEALPFGAYRARKARAPYSPRSEATKPDFSLRANSHSRRQIMAIFKVTPATSVFTNAFGNRAFDSDSSGADNLIVDPGAFLISQFGNGAVLAPTGAWIVAVN